MLKKEYKYNTSVNWESGSKGILTEPTMPSISVASPIDFEKGIPNTWTAEHFLISAANVCLMTTFTAIAENSKLNLLSYSSEVEGKMERNTNMFFSFTEIIIKPIITVEEEREIERAERLLKKAEKICPISNSLKAIIILEPQISAK